MDDKFLKYSKLYILIFLMFLSIPVIIGFIIAIFYGISKVVSSGPVDLLFEMMIISMPAAVFSTVYIIFFRRTKHHPNNIIRIISMILFVIGFILSVTFLILDFFSYFKKQGIDINDLRSFSIPFLAGNTGGLFLIAIIQAFTTAKEKDWIEKNKEKEMRL